MSSSASSSHTHTYSQVLCVRVEITFSSEETETNSILAYIGKISPFFISFCRWRRLLDSSFHIQKNVREWNISKINNGEISCCFIQWLHLATSKSYIITFSDYWLPLVFTYAWAWFSQRKFLKTWKCHFICHVSNIDVLLFPTEHACVLGTRGTRWIPLKNSRALYALSQSRLRLNR